MPMLTMFRKIRMKMAISNLHGGGGGRGGGREGGKSRRSQGCHQVGKARKKEKEKLDVPLKKKELTFWTVRCRRRRRGSRSWAS